MTDILIFSLFAFKLALLTLFLSSKSKIFYLKRGYTSKANKNKMSAILGKVYDQGQKS